MDLCQDIDRNHHTVFRT